ncbi:MAG TPA: NfeD family protein, partial [Candidatus Mediterraneibacter excrementigallinarum]|nr:NfeD family protein [Candidatus Mediterraneibacter excrementigallinarum]
TAVARGLEWTARSENNGEKLPAGSLAQVVAVSGVKLILKPYEEVEK